MICPKCKQALPDDSEFCQYCGSRLAEASAVADNAAPATSPELAGKTCPFCKAPFMEGEAVVFCSHCEMPHHLDCWKENGGCTTFGCTGNIGKIIGAEQKNAQSAPVATRRPAPPAPPQAIPYPSSRTGHKEIMPTSRTEQGKDLVLVENADRIIQGSIPVLLERTRIQKAADGRLHAVCSFVPLTDKQIQAMQVDVQCSDVWRERVQSVEGYQYLDLRTRRDTPFGEAEKIPLPDPNTRVIDVVIRKIMFADGTLIRQTGTPERIPDALPLSKLLSNELREEYKTQTYQNARVAPVNRGAIWICTCGAVNREEEETCHLCGDSLAVLTSHLDKDMLQKSVDEKKRIQREKEERERIVREEADRLQKEKEEHERKEREERQRLQRAEAEERARLIKKEQEKESWGSFERAEKKKAKKRGAVFSVLAALLLAIGCMIVWQMIPSIRYKKAEAAFAAGDYEAAYQGFVKVGDYRDGKERALAARYAQGKAALQVNDYDVAYGFFSEIAGYKNSDTMAKESLYRKAESLMKDGKYKAAAEVFSQLEGYKDSDERIVICQSAQKGPKAAASFGSEGKDSGAGINPGKSSSYGELMNVKVGDYVFFGHYEQDNDIENGEEPIEWLILAKEGGRILVVSNYALDSQRFHTSPFNIGKVTWETCTLRGWLNEAFLNTAFTEEERALIPSVTVEADKNPQSRKESGNSTTDQVFLLSITEAARYFSSDNDRQCQVTDYCYAHGLGKNYQHLSLWWLRTPGAAAGTFSIVGVEGVVKSNGLVITAELAVRPAMWIEIG